MAIVIILLLLFRTRDNLLATSNTRPLDYLDKKHSRPVKKLSTGQKIIDPREQISKDQHQ